MLYHKIRIGLIFLFIGLGVLIHLQKGLNPALYLYGASVILILTHFLFGTVWSAFANMKRGKMKQAELLLKQVKKPEWLFKTNRAYYHFIKGMIALQKKDLDTGQTNLDKALELGLRTETDKAFATLNLGHIAFVQKKYDLAKELLIRAKSYNTNDLRLKENLSKMEATLTQMQ